MYSNHSPETFLTCLDSSLCAAVDACEEGEDGPLEESPFLQALMALKAGLQASPAACEGFSKALLQLSGRPLPACTCVPRASHLSP